MNNLLYIKNLHTNIEETNILKGIDLEVQKGEIHVIMGPNGAGKSTLANTLMGHPRHTISEGEIILDGQVINDLRVDERAKEGIFLSFQYPEEIPGVTVENFLRTAKSNLIGEKISFFNFHKELSEKMKLLNIKKEYARRYLNVGFSGGEKKKNEILQMAILNPKLAILDETDSGLDIDAIKTVADGVRTLSNDDNAIIVITHYNKIIDYLQPDYVHVLADGKIIKSGGMELAEFIDNNGFENIV
ncbi:Fe-S cluster assembly ATPase SufC [Vallitalea okinawensis]|uniref:Fe-S cluster assembly ATPase SufC n=1 Tax=Vallitalea okinawensis TaxID=2078660 RepID=UPI002E8E4A13|nr:Fe-S cluster assembly ATPase SufC [Vallitalea okinawensis]